MKIDYNKIVEYQEECKHSLPSDKAIEYIALTRELMHQAIDNNNQLSDNSLYISGDFNDDAIFYVFLNALNTKVLSIKKITGRKIVTF